MKAVALICVVLLASGSAFAKGSGGRSSSGGSHHVSGHVTKNGTYVAPHQATNPNNTKTDNWSSKGNVNPYTGKDGTKDPYAPSTPKKD
jgi:hypothetical protein